MKKLLLIDLDDTLADTSEFKKTMFAAVAKKTSKTIKEVQKKYNLLKKDTPLQEGWPEVFALSLTKNPTEKEGILNAIYGSTKSLKLKNDILSYVKNFNGSKHIVTLGDKKLHSKKIRKLGIRKYFDGVLYVADDKGKFIENLIKGGRLVINGRQYKDVVLVDDRPYLLNNLERYHWIKIINPKDI